jgi:hypothetical protein
VSRQQLVTFSYDPQPKQALLHTTLARRILYGGAAGGGKSHALRHEGYLRCVLNPGAQVYLFRRTLNNLEKNHIVKLPEEVPQEIATFNRNRYALEFVNGSILWFCYADSEADVENYQGAEIHELLLDEAALFTPRQIGYLRSRIRLGSYQPRQPQFLPREVMGSNPGGPAHEFLKQTMVAPAVPGEIFLDHKAVQFGGQPIPCIYIPARMGDNRHLDANYAAQFADMPEHTRRMFVDGDWDAIAGSFFDCWDAKRHVIPTVKVPDHWMRFRSIDWGHATPFSVGWWAVSDGSPLSLRDGSLLPTSAETLVRYREWYGGQADDSGAGTNKGLRLQPGELAKGILERTAPGEAIAYTVIDPSAARADTGPSAREQLARAGVTTIPGDNKRESGWQEVYGRLNQGKLLVMDCCRDFARTIPLLMPKEINPEDVEKGGEDHVADEARYACMSRPWVSVQKAKAEEQSPLQFNRIMADLRRQRKRKRG